MKVFVEKLAAENKALKDEMKSLNTVVSSVYASVQKLQKGQ